LIKIKILTIYKPLVNAITREIKPYLLKINFYFEDELSLSINTVPIVLCEVHSLGSLNVTMKSKSFFD